MKKVLLGFLVLLIFSGTTFADESIYDNEGVLVAQGNYKDRFYVKVYKKSDGSKNLFLMNYVPHYWEYNSNENPTGYNWCGYAALKVSMFSVSNKEKTLSDIYLVNKARTSVNSADDFPTLYSLYLTAIENRYNAYGYNNVYFKNRIQTPNEYLIKVLEHLNKGGISIIGTPYHYGMGHFEIIVGIKVYIETNGNKKYYYLIRDVASHSPESKYFDLIVGYEEYFYGSYPDSGRESVDILSLY